MEVLVLERFSKLKKIDFGTEPKLRKLILKNLPELSNIRSNGKTCLLSSSTFKNFHNLEEPEIINCGMGDRRARPPPKRLDFFPFLFLKFSLYYFLNVLLK